MQFVTVVFKTGQSNVVVSLGVFIRKPGCCLSEINLIHIVLADVCKANRCSMQEIIQIGCGHCEDVDIVIQI